MQVIRMSEVGGADVKAQVMEIMRRVACAVYAYHPGIQFCLVNKDLFIRHLPPDIGRVKIYQTIEGGQRDIPVLQFYRTGLAAAIKFISGKTLFLSVIQVIQVGQRSLSKGDCIPIAALKKPFISGDPQVSVVIRDDTVRGEQVFFSDP